MPAPSFLDELTGLAWGRSVSARSEDGFPGRGSEVAIFNRSAAEEADSLIPGPAWARGDFPGKGSGASPSNPMDRQDDVTETDDSEKDFPGLGSENAIFNRGGSATQEEDDTPPGPAWARDDFPGKGSGASPFNPMDRQDDVTETDDSEKDFPGLGSEKAIFNRSAAEEADSMIPGPAWARDDFPGQPNPVSEREETDNQDPEEDGCQKGPAWLREILEEGCDFQGPPFVGDAGQFPFNFTPNAFSFDWDLPASVNAREPQGLPFVNEDWLSRFSNLGAFSPQGRGNGAPFKG